MLSRRSWLLLLSLLLLSAVMVVAGCLRAQQVRRRQLTGTCNGACGYYMSCKGSDDPALYQACVGECGEVFSDPVSIQAFESLYCADAIAYIEGPGGHEPGQPVDAKDGVASGESARDGDDPTTR